ncbi:MAG: undecaprenyl-diphosphate phosphatase [Acutalibacteraceae bacterium]|nr:undecaprenyl-diphosphate phosphatase [Acutalibacteraceae bacterium]
MGLIIVAIIFGIIEGITEWLPVSSTGHLILFEEILPQYVSKDVWDMFLVIIQLGAILASVILFWDKIWPFQKPDRAEGKKLIKTDSFILWVKVAIATVPGVAFILLGLDEICDKYFYNSTGVSIALIVFGIFFILIEQYNKKRTPKYDALGDITYSLALYIGIFQLLAAAFPGTSRSGATILGALLLGVSRVAASEFTFILAIPAMLGASVLKIFDFTEKGIALQTNDIIFLAVGTVCAFIVSVLAIKFLMGYIKKHNFEVFGYYRIALGVAVLLVFNLILK